MLKTTGFQGSKNLCCKFNMARQLQNVCTLCYTDYDLKHPYRIPKRLECDHTFCAGKCCYFYLENFLFLFNQHPFGSRKRAIYDLRTNERRIKLRPAPLFHEYFICVFSNSKMLLHVLISREMKMQGFADSKRVI